MTIPSMPKKISLLKRELPIQDKNDPNYGLRCNRRFKQFDNGDDMIETDNGDIYLLEETVKGRISEYPIAIYTYPIKTNVNSDFEVEAIPKKDMWGGYLNAYAGRLYNEMCRILRLLNGDFTPVKEAFEKLSQKKTIQLTTPNFYLFNEAETNLYVMNLKELNLDKLLPEQDTIILPETMFEDVFIDLNPIVEVKNVK